MTFKNIFEKENANDVVSRIQQLTPESKPEWGKMNVAQMLAHLCVQYELVYEPEKFKKPSGFERFIIKLLAKKQVVGEKPYPKNGRTAPIFVIADKRDFDVEKNRLINFIHKTQELGENHFDGKDSHSFGKLTKNEWNTLFYKHIDHHLRQFAA